MGARRREGRKQKARTPSCGRRGRGCFIDFERSAFGVIDIRPASLTCPHLQGMATDIECTAQRSRGRTWKPLRAAAALLVVLFLAAGAGSGDHSNPHSGHLLAPVGKDIARKQARQLIVAQVLTPARCRPKRSHMTGRKHSSPPVFPLLATALDASREKPCILNNSFVCFLPSQSPPPPPPPSLVTAQQTSGCPVRFPTGRSPCSKSTSLQPVFGTRTPYDPHAEFLVCSQSIGYSEGLNGSALTVNVRPKAASSCRLVLAKPAAPPASYPSTHAPKLALFRRTSPCPCIFSEADTEHTQCAGGNGQPSPVLLRERPIRTFLLRPQRYSRYGWRRALFQDASSAPVSLARPCNCRLCLGGDVPGLCAFPIRYFARSAGLSACFSSAALREMLAQGVWGCLQPPAHARLR